MIQRTKQAVPGSVPLDFSSVDCHNEKVPKNLPALAPRDNSNGEASFPLLFALVNDGRCTHLDYDELHCKMLPADYKSTKDYFL